jgi:acetoin utilization protein AcuB
MTHPGRPDLFAPVAGATLRREDLVTARDLMTPNPVTVSPRATVAEVWDLMRELEIRHVPVVEDGALVGMLSDRDLARLDVARLLTAEGADALRRELATPVIEVMSSDVVFVELETELSDVVGLLIEHRVGAIPVVRPDTRDVVGIVSYVDVLRAVQDLLEEE